jgi:hypothetical protein
VSNSEANNEDYRMHDDGGDNQLRNDDTMAEDDFQLEEEIQSIQQSTTTCTSRGSDG